MHLADTAHDVDNHQMTVEFLLPHAIPDTYRTPRSVHRCPLSGAQVVQDGRWHHELAGSILLALCGV